jgi:hypothetical protein
MLASGSTLSIENTCFINNDFFNFGAVNVFHGTAISLARNNYGTIDSDLQCPFVAQADSLEAAFNIGVSCVDFDATECTSEASLFPTQMPTFSEQSPEPESPASTLAPSVEPGTSPSSHGNMVWGNIARAVSCLAVIVMWCSS